MDTGGSTDSFIINKIPRDVQIVTMTTSYM